jgi:hypothetical protein
MEEIQIDNLTDIGITTQPNGDHYLGLIMSNDANASGLYLLLFDEEVTVKYKYTDGRSYFELFVCLNKSQKCFSRVITLTNKTDDWMTWLDEKKANELWVCHPDKNKKIVRYAQAILL